jgi:peptidoglycan/LPS O-acetylase OafA/YrhL
MIAAMPSRNYERFAGRCALLVAVVGLAYSLTFVIVVADEPKWAQVANAVFLLSGGLLAVAVLIAVYGRLRDVEPAFALLALALGLASGLGSAIHGAEEFALEVRRAPARPGSAPLIHAASSPLRCPDWLSYSSAGSCGAEGSFHGAWAT